MPIRSEIPAIEGVKDDRVSTILGAIKGLVETITGRTPNRQQLKTLGAGATFGGVITKINEIINRLQDADKASIPSPQRGTFNGTIGVDSPAAGFFTTLAVSGLISANGGQIAFPATANPSADVNTLDDYEEGTWTPVITFAVPGDLNVVYGQQTGIYTKIGNTVHVNCTLTASTFTYTTASGNNRISGFPFAGVTLSGIVQQGVMAWQGITKANYTHANMRLSSGTTIGNATMYGSGQAIAILTTADMPSGTQQNSQFNMSYLT